MQESQEHSEQIFQDAEIIENPEWEEITQNAEVEELSTQCQELEEILK